MDGKLKVINLPNVISEIKQSMYKLTCWNVSSEQQKNKMLTVDDVNINTFFNDYHWIW